MFRWFRLLRRVLRRRPLPPRIIYVERECEHCRYRDSFERESG